MQRYVDLESLQESMKLRSSPILSPSFAPPDRKPITEFSGMPGAGKSTLTARWIVEHAAERVGQRPHFSAPMRRMTYLALMLGQPRRWYGLYRVLRGILPAGSARRRVRMYIKHLWRRREQIRSAHIDRLIEDEAFATWFARDLDRCPDLWPWLQTHIDFFYPRRVGRSHADYSLVVLELNESTRAERLWQRRLKRGEDYAKHEHTRYGAFESRQSAVQSITDLLAERGLVTVRIHDEANHSHP